MPLCWTFAIFVNPLLISWIINGFLQCKKYRGQFTEEKKAVYEEKLEASEIFKDKKALYPSRSADKGGLWKWDLSS